MGITTNSFNNSEKSIQENPEKIGIIKKICGIKINSVELAVTVKVRNDNEIS